MDIIKVYTDGGARGNPGPAAIGGIIFQNNTELKTISEYIGITTNNQAEYKAIIAALEWIRENDICLKEIVCHLDSQLVVEQLNGNYKVKNQDLAPLFLKTKRLSDEIKSSIKFVYVPRNQNKTADKLVNKALDREFASKNIE